MLAGRFLASVAERLKLPARFVFPAYRRQFLLPVARRRAAANVTAQDSRLRTKLERERLRKVFSQGLDKVIGQVLPLARSAAMTAGKVVAGTCAITTAAWCRAIRRWAIACRWLRSRG